MPKNLNEFEKLYAEGVYSELMRSLGIWNLANYTGVAFDMRSKETNGTEGSFQHTLAGRVAALEEAVKAHPSPQSGGRRKKPRPLPSKVLTGPKGGKYVIKAGQKVYV